MSRAYRAFLTFCIAMITVALFAICVYIAYDRGHVDGQLQEAEGSLDVIRGLLDGCTLRPTP